MTVTNPFKWSVAALAAGTLLIALAGVERWLPAASPLSQMLSAYQAELDPGLRTEMAYEIVTRKFAQDLRGDDSLTPSERKVYENAVSHLDWSMQLVGFYLNQIPDYQVKQIRVNLNGQIHSVDMESARKLLVEGLLQSIARCSDEDMNVLKRKFPATLFNRNLADLVRIFLVLHGEIESQLISQVQPRVLALASESGDRAVIESFFRIRQQAAERAKASPMREKEMAAMLQSSSQKSQAIAAYAAAPGCFQGTAAIKLLRRIRG